MASSVIEDIAGQLWLIPNDKEEEGSQFLGVENIKNI